MILLSIGLLLVYTAYRLSRVVWHPPDKLIRRGPNRSVYMRRWWVFKNPFVCVYVHRLLQPDWGDALHNHPRASLGFVLSGGYDQVTQTGFQRIRRWHVNLLRLHTFHRIVDVRPNTWTLFVGGPVRRGWGFLTPAGRFVEHDEYNRPPGR